MEERGFTDWVGALARDHSRRLAGVAAREGLSSTDAIDAVQEAFHTFLSMPQARDLVGAVDDTSKMLAVIVRNAARNMRRRHHRSVPHEDIDELALAEPSASADVLIERAEERVALLGCIHALGRVQRAVVTLRMLEELANDEVATQLSMTPNHIAVLLRRAKATLMQCLVHDPELGTR